MRRLSCCLLLSCAAALAGSGSLFAGATTGAPLLQPAAADAQPAARLAEAERVLVRKSERRLYLLSGQQVLRSYRIALGLIPVGSKERAGDYRTPEGSYRLTRRNAHSDFFLSIQVSYPGPNDLQRAQRHHEDPGGEIMVHGQPNVPHHPPDYYARQDWTDGCIALSNTDMSEFWLLTHDDMPIDIEP